MANTAPTKVVTGLVRFSYVHVFEPTAVSEGSSDKKYNISIIIPKRDKATLKKIEAAIDAAKELGMLTKWGNKMPKNLRTPLRDGDLERDDECYADSMFLSAKSSSKPGIVDENLNEIISKDEFYSGCYGRASLNFYPFDVNGSKGIACGLNNLQKLKDGERLGGGFSSAADDFGDDDDLD